MKHYIYACTCILICCIGYLTAPRVYGEYLFSTGVRYDMFADDLDPESSGFEISIPVGAAYRRKSYSLSLETAYISAHVTPDDEGEVSVSNMSDMLISASYTHSFANRPLGLIVGLDLNLPTGKERLSKREKFAEAGQSNDLFEVDNLGDGLNVGMSLGIMGDIKELSAGIQGAYVVNGEYDSTRDTPDDDIDPGDQMLALALLGWQTSPRLTLETFLVYSHFFPDTVMGQESFRAGNNLVFGTSIRYDRKPVGIALSLQGTMQGKNQELTKGALHAERENSNGKDFFGLLNVTYRPFSKLILRVLGDVRYYGESDLKTEESGLPFESQRIRYAAGPGFVYALTEHISCDGLIKFFTMTQKPDATLAQEVTFQGINFDLGFTYTL